MFSKIHVLDEPTINKIAAGEVIENPASVVKELVENALDAGSTEITIEIRAGGRELIRVTDNGEGMHPDDALLCFERHATSKIRDIDDLHTLSSMGFRGEALSSIASISKLTLLTTPRHQEKGTVVIVEGGKILQSSPAAGPSGTTFEVKGLFFNVPVRQKFQRSPTYDTGEILKKLTAIALAYPEIKFTLTSNGKVLLKTSLPPSGSFESLFKERLSQVLGKECAQELCFLESVKEEVSLSGFIGLPSQTRHNRSGHYLFINHRAVFCPLISHAVKEGYGTMLSPQRYPVYALHLTLPGQLVDVNVHPQKREVRLRKESLLHDMIRSAVEKALAKSGAESTTALFSITTRPSFSPPPYSFSLDRPLVVKERMPEPFLTNEVKTERPLKVSATLPGYILLTLEGGSLMMIDQQAAHARILYEQLKNQDRSSLPSQQFLIPLTFEATVDEAEAIREQIGNLKKWGLSIQEFGTRSFAIEAAPCIWADVNLEELIRSVLCGLKDPVHEVEKRLASSAARAALSPSKKLSLEEASMLFTQLFKCENPGYCPFGKKTFIELNSEEIAHLFKG